MNKLNINTRVRTLIQEFESINSVPDMSALTEFVISRLRNEVTEAELNQIENILKNIHVFDLIEDQFCETFVK